MANCRMCKVAIQGRVDKKYCSTSCKNAYHSRLSTVTKDAARVIDKILHRNRSILLEIIGKHKGSIKVPRVVLDQKRFNFTYHTHSYTNTQQKEYRYVYDIAWMEFSDDEILIIRKHHQGNE